MQPSIRTLLDDPELKNNVPVEVKRFKQNQVIVNAGETAQEVYLILKGTANVIAESESHSGHKHLPGLAKLQENELFGEMSLFDFQLRSANVIAASDCEVAVYDSKALVQYMDSHPHIGYRILRSIFDLMIHRMRQDNMRVNTLMALYLREALPDNEVDCV